MAATDPKSKKKRNLIIGGLFLAAGGAALLFWPKKAAAAPGAPAGPGPNPSTAYTIQAGDSLSAIASSRYGGKAAEYLAIMLLDRNRLSSAIGHLNLIRAGQTIQIPTREAVDALPSAVKDTYRRRWQAYVRVGTADPRYWGAAYNPADKDPSIAAPTPLPGGVAGISGLDFLAAMRPFGTPQLGSMVLSEVDPDLAEHFEMNVPGGIVRYGGNAPFPVSAQRGDFDF